MSTGSNVLVSGVSRLTGQSLAGLSVGEVRERFAAALSIPAGATATINGIAVSDSQKIVNGEELVFAKPLGQKG